MTQQILVKMPNGSVYVFDKQDFQYYCTHENYRIEEIEVDTMKNGEHDTYLRKIAVCENLECQEQLEDYQVDEDLLT